MKKSKNNNASFQRKLTALAILGTILLFAFLKMYQSFSVDLLMKDIHNLEQRKRALVNRAVQLQSEVDRLRNINRITQLAREKRNLITSAEPVFYLKLEDYKKLKDLKEGFARRNERNREALNLAGVQTGK